MFSIQAHVCSDRFQNLRFPDIAVSLYIHWKGFVNVNGKKKELGKALTSLLYGKSPLFEAQKVRIRNWACVLLFL